MRQQNGDAAQDRIFAEMSTDEAVRFDSHRLRLWRSRAADLKPSFVETLDTIERFGWQRWSIASNEPDDLDFAYTVGLSDMFDFPELIAVGFPVKVGGAALNEAFEMMRQGRDLTQGRVKGVLGGNIEVEFHRVHPRWLHRVMLRAHWYYEGKDVPVLQLVYPDLENRFQWEDGFNEFFRQPMLAPGYPEQDLEKEFWDSHDMSFQRSAWRFPDPPSTRVMTSEEIESGQAGVTYVAHYGDGTWMFLGDAEADSPPQTSRLRLVNADPSLVDIADLPRGWTAVRAGPGKRWERFEESEEDDSTLLN